MHTQHQTQISPLSIPKGFFLFYWWPCAIAQFYLATVTLETLGFRHDEAATLAVAGAAYPLAWVLTRMIPWFKRTLARRAFAMFGLATVVGLVQLVVAIAVGYYSLI